MRNPPLFIPFIIALIMAAAFSAGCSTAPAAAPPAPADTSAITAEEARAIATDAYVFAYPLVTMEMSRRVLTNVPYAGALPGRAPINQFGHAPALPTPVFQAVVRPNVDTMYSSAMLDLSQEPVVLSVPDTSRYYLMPICNAWSDVIASPGTRTTGNMAGDFAIAGPGWNGTLPANVTLIRSPTTIAWMVGRTQTNGPADYPAVHAIQAQYRLVPLSASGRPYTPPDGTPDPRIDMKTPTPDQVNAMNATAYFSLAAMLMKDNPPYAADAPLVAAMAKIGIVPGREFSSGPLDPAVAQAIAEAPAAGQARIIANMSHPGKKTATGWYVPYDFGNFGTNYDSRAAAAWVLFGGNRAEDAIYPMTLADSEGRPLDGAYNYTLRMSAADRSVGKAFWSVTVYNQKGFLVQNAINRSAISSWMAIKENPDGSADILIRQASPGTGMEANWLPAPEGPFTLMMRIYWPEEQVLNGTWVPPAVVRDG